MKNSLVSTFRALAFSVSLSVPCLVSAQMAVADYTTTTNDRFEDDVSFFAGAFDFSGVGRSSSGRWATLVSNNVFVSAGHAHPAVGDTITFHHSNDPLGATTTRTVSGGVTLAGGDAWVGWLNAPVGAGVTYYDIPNQPAATQVAFASTSIANSNILTVGRSSSGNKSAVAQTNFVVGQNMVDEFYAGAVISGITNDVIQWFQDEPSDADKILYESKSNTGDSGGPSFYANGTGGIDIVGVHFSIGKDWKNGVVRNYSTDTYLPNYRAAIASQISLHAVTVPEPSSVVLLGLTGLLSLFWRVKR